MAVRRAALVSLILTIAIILGIMQSGCVRGTNSADNYQFYSYKEPKKVGVVLSGMGMVDAAANSAVAAGVKKAAADLDAEYKILAPKDLVNNEESLRYLAENNFDLVIAIGRGMQDNLGKVAPDYPDIKFAVFGGDIDEPNVAAVVFNEDEGAFLAGVEAASVTKSNLVGFIGGSVTSDRKMENGFAKGVQYVNLTEGKKVKVNAVYAGVTDEAANDPERGKALANTLYWTGSDVVFSGTGKLGNGAAAAAVQNRKIAICADLQVMQASAWNVYGALVKNQEAAAIDIVKKTINGKFLSGRVGYGLAEGAVDFVPSQALPPDIAGKLAAVKAQVKKGQIKPYTILIPKDLVTQIKQMPVDLNKPPAGGPGTILPGQTGGQTNTGTSTGKKKKKPALTDKGQPGGDETGALGADPTGGAPTGGTPSDGSPTGGSTTPPPVNSPNP